MVLNITRFIATKIKEHNTYLSEIGVNAYQQKDKIVSFAGDEKRDFSASDITGLGAYLRIDPNIDYTKSDKREQACENRYIGKVEFRVVVYNTNKRIDPFKVENKIIGTGINFSEYTGKEQDIKLSVKRSNLNTDKVYKEESTSELKTGTSLQMLAINYELEWSFRKEDCIDNCEIWDKVLCQTI